MKIIEVPYNQKVQSVIEYVIPVLLFGGIIFMILGVMIADWTMFFISSLISIPVAILIWKTKTFQVFFSPKDFIMLINDIDDNGFSIGNLKTASRLNWGRNKISQTR